MHITDNDQASIKEPGLTNTLNICPYLLWCWLDYRLSHKRRLCWQVCIANETTSAPVHLASCTTLYHALAHTLIGS